MRLPKRKIDENAMAPGAHGGDGARLARALDVDIADILDLSQSLNPVAPPVVPVVARHLDELTRYPDATRATSALAEAMQVDAERLLLTNGGAEAIALVATEFGRGWVDDPDFSLYRRHIPVLDPDGPRFRSNPHSPSGTLARDDEHAAVWDEAFYPLSTGRWSRGDDDAVVVGSLTKLFACPGLRLGYVRAPDDTWVKRLRARQPAWSVNALASAALPDLLARADLPEWAARVAVLRRDLVAMLARHGWSAQSADANWVLVPAPRLRAELLGFGILVRDCASFGLPGTVRIAVPDARGLERLDDALGMLDASSPAV